MIIMQLSINNYERLQDIILFLKIPMRTRKNFFEIYIQLGQALSSRFPSPGLDHKNDLFPSVIMKYTKFSLRMVYNTSKHVGEVWKKNIVYSKYILYIWLEY
jgi:hypothetical protein